MKFEYSTSLWNVIRDDNDLVGVISPNDYTFSMYDYWITVDELKEVVMFIDKLIEQLQ